MQDVRKAFRSRARLLHPDVSDAPDSEELFLELVRAVEAIQSGAQIVMGSRMSTESIELSVELARGLAVSALFRTPEADAQLRGRLLPVWSEKVMDS